jgi:hypothetical protein
MDVFQWTLALMSRAIAVLVTMVTIMVFALVMHNMVELAPIRADQTTAS